ncbi:uncharacterized protein DUF397 [Streptomyces sp. Ag109_G2-6]|uniref:DUF397 domain-containing protein n=1 Tax=Streptomyces sp. Ag109_G2-6 TaxID=2485154 RepID=UPI000F4E90AE|nr:DUF397 domain-containing protein [Streptomyces sp. Ag109_G2-6]RPF46239.1 uncharacterized protein DUF397 [Streptomyces sp. Ag109_G2-6]
MRPPGAPDGVHRQRPSWHKSTYSSGDGDSCVEVATCTDTVHIRDSKLAASPELKVDPSTWTAFLGGVTA